MYAQYLHFLPVAGLRFTLYALYPSPTQQPHRFKRELAIYQRDWIVVRQNTYKYVWELKFLGCRIEYRQMACECTRTIVPAASTEAPVPAAIMPILCSASLVLHPTQVALFHSGPNSLSDEHQM